MSIKKAILRKIGVAVTVERNELGEMDVLIHKEARHHAAHGFVVASNKAMNIRGGTVAVVLPDFDEAPELTVRLMLDLQEAFHAKGWILSHIAAWATVGQVAANVAAGEDEHGDAWNASVPTASPLAAQHTPHGSDVPAFLRRQQNAAAPEGFRQEISAGVLTFPRQGQSLQRSLVDDPNVRLLVNAASERVKHLDEVAREAAKVRFEAIASNAQAQAHSNEYIADKLNAAAEMILSTHKLQSNAEAAYVQH